MKNLLPVLVIGAFLLQGCAARFGNDNLEPHNGDIPIPNNVYSGYPSTLIPIAPQQLQEYTDAFHRSNNGFICSTLNKYGLTVGPSSSCFDHVRQLVKRIKQNSTPLSKKTAIAIAKQVLVKNKAYTNVTSAQKLRVYNAYPVYGDHPDWQWRVAFKDQKYHGMKVEKTAITVWLYAKGAYRIDGHWYRNIFIPQNVNVSRSEALKAAIGYGINFSDWTGPEHLVVNREILPSPDSLEKQILPYKSGDNLQLRVVWKFNISNGFFSLYVGTMEKKVFGHEQLVMF